MACVGGTAERAAGSGGNRGTWQSQADGLCATATSTLGGTGASSAPRHDARAREGGEGGSEARRSFLYKQKENGGVSIKEHCGCGW